VIDTHSRTGGLCCDCRATRARYPVHHPGIEEAAWARRITIVFDENMTDEKYADRGNGI
jgi:hypothetical protein